MSFNKLVIASVALFAANSAIAAPQLGGLPSIVCLTGTLGSVGSTLLDGLGITILDCSTGETCTALDIPILGDLLPIGTCETSS